MMKLTPGIVSALLYIGMALAASGVFLGITATRDYTWVARGGGAAWIFLLSTVILMPIIIPAVRKWLGQKSEK